MNTTLAPHSLPIYAGPILRALEAQPYDGFQDEDVTITLRYRPSEPQFARHPIVLQRAARILQRKLKQAERRIRLLEERNAQLTLSMERIRRGERGDGRPRRINAGRRFAAR